MTEVTGGYRRFPVSFAKFLSNTFLQKNPPVALCGYGCLWSET